MKENEGEAEVREREKRLNSGKRDKPCMGDIASRKEGLLIDCGDARKRMRRMRQLRPARLCEVDDATT
jgi:hypothetical protein